MNLKSNLLPGGVLILLGAYMTVTGIQAVPHGHVAGGPIIWVIFFSACALFGGTGIYILFRRDAPQQGPLSSRVAYLALLLFVALVAYSWYLGQAGIG